MSEYLEWGENTHYKHNGKPITLVEKLLKIGLNEEKIKKVIEAINTTCSECWDTDTANKTCTCTWDE
jgi:hypothetical protein